MQTWARDTATTFVSVLADRVVIYPSYDLAEKLYDKKLFVTQVSPGVISFDLKQASKMPVRSAGWAGLREYDNGRSRIFFSRDKFPGLKTKLYRMEPQILKDGLVLRDKDAKKSETLDEGQQKLVRLAGPIPTKANGLDSVADLKAAVAKLNSYIDQHPEIKITIGNDRKLKASFEI